MKTRLLFILMVSLAVSNRLSGATFTVVNTNAAGIGSLQQAILDANASAGADIISFNIVSGGLTISPTNALPVITDPITIDGGTQPGFVGAPIIELNGASAGATVDGLNLATSNSVIRALVINRFLGDGIEITNGSNNAVEGCYLGLNRAGLTDQGNTLNGILLTNSPNNTIGGLTTASRNYIAGNNQSGIHLGGASASNNVLLGNFIGLNVANAAIANSVDGVRVNAPFNVIGGSAAGSRNFISGNTGQGIEITAAGGGTLVRGNHIGTDDSGALDRGNSLDGILAAAGGVVIGGANTGEGNLISGNTGDGIELNGASATNIVVLGNAIGINLSATAALANGGNGVFITTSSRGSLIGGVLAGQANLIAFNTGDGINVAAAVANTNNTFRGNSIFSNGNLGIDLGAAGITANDAGDADTGANQLQNFPVLTAASNTPAGTTVFGTISSRAGTAYTLDFYSSVNPNALGSGEGQAYLGSATLSTDGAGLGTFSVGLPVVALAGRYISATATDDFGNTSEFSTNVIASSTIAGLTFTVVNTNNSGPGSFRQAILDANASITAGDTIRFAITNAVTTISPASALPTIIDPVIIDGYTQPGAAANTSAGAFNAVLPVRISGTGAGAGANGLLVTAGGSIVRGLRITGFAGDGIELAGLGGNIVEGCAIGVDAAGASQANTANGVLISGGSHGNSIGGVLPGQANLIAFNGQDGISVAAAVANTNNAFRRNSIFSNGDLGIDLGTTGVTVNDANDVDTGANQLQNFPVLSAVTTNSPAEVTVAGSLASAAGTTYSVDFYASTTLDTSGHGEGQFYLGSTNLTTDGSGLATFGVSFATGLSGRYVSATATDSNGNTSEFARWVVAVSANPPPNSSIQTADFVFIIDASVSMAGEIAAVKNGLGSFVTGLNTNSIDARFAIVLFGGPTEVILDFTSDQATTEGVFDLISVNGALPGIHNNHNLNPEAGLEAIRIVLNAATNNTLQRNNVGGSGPLAFRPGARKNLILVTDENSDLPFYVENRQAGQTGTEPPSVLTAPWQAEVDATAAAVIANNAFVNLLISPSATPSKNQYGDPTQSVSDASFLNYNPQATLSNLVATGYGGSLQAQVLAAGLVGRAFNITSVNTPSFIANFFSAKVEEIINNPTPRPRLNIYLLDSAVWLTWTTNSPGFLLETNRALTLTNGWGVLTTNYSIVGTNYAVTNSINDALRFYRLRK